MPSLPTDSALARDPDAEPQPPARCALSVHDLIQELSAGRRSADDLLPAQRRLCVDHLTDEGFTNTDIARVLRVSARTVTRDRLAARRDHAVQPDCYLGDELLGEYERLTLVGIARLTRLTRDSDTPAYARLWAEEAIHKMYQRFIDTAHRLKYLATGSSRLQQQRDNDPAENQRLADRFAALRRTATLV